MSGQVITDDAQIVARAGALKKVAVLGIKTEAQAEQPAYYVPKYLVGAGVEVVPVPVYYPEATHILDRPVVRALREVGPVDAVVVFRRSSDVAGHADELIALRPSLVWLQLGIRDDRVAARLAEAGIDVVQDRCLMVDHRRASGGVDP
jgi:predicted CoA-binding protein